MQSLLIDINTAAITYRRQCLYALDRKYYATCYGCIKAMNGLLPADTEEKKYRIKFDTQLYNETVKGGLLAECAGCKKTLDRGTLTILNVRLDHDLRFVTGKEFEKIWVCPFCQYENILQQTKIIEKVLEQPNYPDVLPEPPVKKHGLLDQIEYHKKVIEWVWLCLDSLEEAFTRYRKDYKPQSWELENIEVDNSLDEDDY